MINHSIKWFTLVLLLMFPTPTQAGAEFDLRVTGNGSAAFPSGIEDNQGKVGWYNTGFSVSSSNFTLNFETRVFNWSRKKNLPFGNQKDVPWESLSKIGLNYKYSDIFNGKWGYFVGGGLFSAFEEEIAASSAGWAYGGIFHVLSPMIQIRAGAIGCLDHVDGQAIPMISLDYNQGSAQGLSFSLGIPETDFHYGFNPRLGVRLNFSFDQFTYRLSDKSTVMKKGYLRQQEAVAALRLEYKPWERFLVSVGPEYHFMGKFILFDRDGDKYDDYDIQPSLGMGMQMEYGF